MCSSVGINPGDSVQTQWFAEANMSFFGAPAVIFLCSYPGLEPWSLFDLGVLASGHHACSRGHRLSSTIPAFSFISYPDVIRRNLEIPEDMRIVLGIAVGYEDETNPINRYCNERRPIEDVLRIRG